MNEYQHARMIYAILSRLSLRSSQSSSLVLLACQILLLPLNERSGTLRQMPLKKEAKNGTKNHIFSSLTTVDKPNSNLHKTKATAEAIY